MRRIKVHAMAMTATEAAITTMGTTTLVVPSLPLEEWLLSAELALVAVAEAAAFAADPFIVAVAALAAAPSAL